MRAMADVELRRSATAVVTMGALRRLLASLRRPAPILAARVVRLAEFRRTQTLGSRPPSAWARAFTEALVIAGFPGERPLDSTEYQSAAKLHEFLAELATLDRVRRVMACREACTWLEETAKATLFQPEGSDAPVQVLGVLESAGLAFDHLWVLGMTDEAWPLPERVNSLIPPRLQREAGIPQADAAASLEFDRRIAQGWLGAAGEVGFSHARAEADRELLMSPLIAPVACASLHALALPSFPSLHDPIRNSFVLEPIDDRFAPPIGEAAQPAGTSLFRDQSACPFRAFARHRLGARSLEEPPPRPHARERGQLLHSAPPPGWEKLRGKGHSHSLSL